MRVRARIGGVAKRASAAQQNTMTLTDTNTQADNAMATAGQTSTLALKWMGITAGYTNTQLGGGYS